MSGNIDLNLRKMLNHWIVNYVQYENKELIAGVLSGLTVRSSLLMKLVFRT